VGFLHRSLIYLDILQAKQSGSDPFM